MQALPLGRAPIPSPAVLRFLKIQAECLPFLASHSQLRRHHHAAPDNSRLHDWKCLEARRPWRLSEQRTHATAFRGFGSSANNLRWQRPWLQARQKKTGPLQPNDLPPLTSFLDDEGTSTTLGRIVKPTNELRMRCTEFDGDGNVTLVNGAFKKSELIAKVPSGNANICNHCI